MACCSRDSAGSDKNIGELPGGTLNDFAMLSKREIEIAEAEALSRRLKGVLNLRGITDSVDLQIVYSGLYNAIYFV